MESVHMQIQSKINIPGQVFKYPKKMGFCVNDITGTTMNKKKRKRKLARQNSKKKQKKYLVPLSNQRNKFTHMQSKIHFHISYHETHPKTVTVSFLQYP